MIKKIIISIFVLFQFACSNQNSILDLETASLKLSINELGKITQLIDKKNNVDILSKDTTAYVLSLKINDEYFNPVKAEINSSEKTIILKFNNGNEVKIKYDNNAHYLKFHLVSIKENNVDLIVWGPYPTKLNKTIGETIGVSQGEKFAVGIQSLNAKTLGGFPWTDNDCMPQINIFAQNDFSDLSEAGKDYVLYRVEAAKPTKYGSSLQAYCRNRFKERVIENLDHDYYVAPVYNDGGIIGSSITIFGCANNEILNTIEKIEIGENLPHPILEGEWGKKSKASTRAYLIYDFTEKTINDAIKLTKKAGLKYLYHSNPFATWGKFKLNEEYFPNGIEGLKNCVDIAKKNNISLGIHTLSNFITPNDKLVTPIPDNRLGKVGSAVITKNLTSSETTILIDDPKFFDQYKNNNLKTVQINNELIRYGKVINENGWKLIECERGAFGTIKSEHVSGDKIYKLADHGYKVFLTDPELSLEVSKNIADLFNKTGLRQISFDGLEGNRSTGMGNYGEILFTQNWFNNLNDNIKKSFIADASRTTHFFWHIYTRMNWGEPWYADFRESQAEYRLKNQEYFKRNLMPGMLGWFQLRPETSIEDIEWMLARSAAYDAGYAFVVNDNSILGNKNSDEIFKTIGIWEEARLSNLFSDEQKEIMKDVKNEFRLIKKSDEIYELTQIHSFKFIHDKKVRQPGEPIYSQFDFVNPGEKNKIEIILKAVKSDLSNISVEFDNFKKIVFPIDLKQNEILKYDGGKTATIYKSNWMKVKEIDMSKFELNLSKGNHKVIVDCSFNGNEESQAKLEIRFFGEKEELKLK
ncbi:MAG: hypothetical protein IPH62_17270 [Ignavibacteriae bacterium]|nr:hypothetical protein [Ignavibacteriota bacterium]